MSSRVWYRTLAGNMRRRLAAGERVAEVAPTSEFPSWGGTCSAKREEPPQASIATSLAYAGAGFVLAVVLDVPWPVLIGVLVAVTILETVWRSRRRPRGARTRRRAIRSLMMVTDRRLIEGVHPDEFRELSLEHVTDVQLLRGNLAIATIRVSAHGGDRDFHVTSEWPKRRALPAAEAIAEAIRRGTSSRH